MNLKNFVLRYSPSPVISLLKKVHYYQKLKSTTETSEEDLPLLKHFLKEGDHAFDIGANFGTYTKIMAQCVGKSGKVYSFEPIPETFGYLSSNIRKLNLRNVQALNVAVSNKSGQVKMEVPKFADAGDNFYEARIIESFNHKNKTFTVEARTIDQIVMEQKIHPCFIKCDVEGHERFVFEGASDLLTTLKPVLFIEINEDLKIAGTNTSALLDNLKNKGYHLYVNENGMLKKWSGEKKVNYYFLTDDHIRKFKDIIK